MQGLQEENYKNVMKDIKDIRTEKFTIILYEKIHCH